MDKAREKNASEGIAPMGITALNELALSNQPEPRYECPVCLNWLRDPVITTCGHKFCKSCITSWLKNSGHCPIDNINLSMKVDIFPDNCTKREIQDQIKPCPFSNKGCTVRVAPLELDSHIASCEYNQPETSSQPLVRVPCAFQAVGCKDTFDNQEDMNTHLHSDTQSHMSLLMNAYSELKINSDISGASIDAKEQEAMSLWEAPNKDNNKNEAPPLNNTSALIRALYERVVVLEQRNREQDIVIANMSKQLSAFAVAKMKQNTDMLLRYCMGNYIWKIDNFKARMEAMLKDHNKMLYSPGFYTTPNGYRALYERVVVLEQRNREQDIVIANMSKQLSAFAVAKMKQNTDMVLRYCMGNYIWKIDNFKARMEAMLKDHNKMLYSPGFYTTPNGYRFCVRLNISPQNSFYFALHVHMMKTDHDYCLEWPFNGRISFAMINQKDHELTQRDTMMAKTNLIAFRRPTTEICVRGLGYTEYALVNDVIRNAVVHIDALLIKVHIKCV